MSYVNRRAVIAVYAEVRGTYARRSREFVTDRFFRPVGPWVSMTHRPNRPLPGPLRRGEKFKNRDHVLVNKFNFFFKFRLLRGVEFVGIKVKKKK